MDDIATPGRDRVRIKHIIVLMMENRSFDHLLGYLDHDNPAFPNLGRVKPSCPVDPADPDGRRVSTTDGASAVLGDDPDHSHQAVMLQIFGRPGEPGAAAVPTMSGFIDSYRRKISDGSLRPVSRWQRLVSAVLDTLKVWWSRLRGRPGPILAKPDEIMKCFPESEIPVLAFLAKQFAVMVNWHAAVPGETWPNRQYAHAATSHGAANIEIDFYDDDTVFNRLDDAGASWGIYQDGVAQVWAFRRLWLGGLDHFHDMDRLHRDIEAGTLPVYSFIEPNHGYGRGEGNSQHPGNNTAKGESFVAGEALIARVYNALVARPELFAQTLLLVTYDEHGGFFDHVPPRAVTRPDDYVDRSGFDFSLSGIRVPAVAVSPLIPAGFVDDTFFDHSAIPAMIRRQFAADTEPLGKREAASANPLDVLPLLAAPRSDIRTIPSPAAPAGVREAAADHTLNDFQASLVELAGAVRNAREQTAGRPGAEAFRLSRFTPDPRTHAAAEQRVLTPGSPADRVVVDVVADFAREDTGRDPADAEFGD